MQFDAKLTGEAASLARDHSDLLRRLPATVHAFVLVQLQKWPILFPAEQRYQRALLELLSGWPEGGLLRAVSGIARVEAEAGIHALAKQDPAHFQDGAQAHLRKERRLQAWRTEIDRFFREIDPAIDAQLFPPDAPRRLVLQLYGSNIAIQTEKIWSRFTGVGMRVPLALGTTRASEEFLRSLFGKGERDDRRPALFQGRGPGALDPLEAWIIESHDALHQLWGGLRVSGAPLPSRPEPPSAAETLTYLSFDRLRSYRDELTRALYEKIKSGVESPQAFAAYARGLKIAPSPNTSMSALPIVHAFVRDVFLTGNGTLRQQYLRRVGRHRDAPPRPAPSPRHAVWRSGQAETVQQHARQEKGMCGGRRVCCVRECAQATVGRLQLLTFCLGAFARWRARALRLDDAQLPQVLGERAAHGFGFRCAGLVLQDLQALSQFRIDVERVHLPSPRRHQRRA